MEGHLEGVVGEGIKERRERSGGKRDCERKALKRCDKGGGGG